MRCLGIPNTAHFANVTQIEDALQRKACCQNYVLYINLLLFSVWERLKLQKHMERWQPEVEEEYEDSLGNVVNKKTFEDLKRQGLL
jgi:splicing factor 3A subunit 3